MTSTVLILVAGATIAILLIWAVLAWRAYQAWRARADAAENQIIDARRRKSAAVAKGNSTRALRRQEARRRLKEETTRQIQMDLRARPSRPSDGGPTGDINR